MKAITRVIFEIELFIFKIKKIGEYVKMYVRWCGFIGKQSREKYNVLKK